MDLNKGLLRNARTPTGQDLVYTNNTTQHKSADWPLLAPDHLSEKHRRTFSGVTMAFLLVFDLIPTFAVSEHRELPMEAAF